MERPDAVEKDCETRKVSDNGHDQNHLLHESGFLNEDKAKTSSEHSDDKAWIENKSHQGQFVEKRDLAVLSKEMQDYLQKVAEDTSKANHGAEIDLSGGINAGHNSPSYMPKVGFWLHASAGNGELEQKPGYAGEAAEGTVRPDQKDLNEHLKAMVQEFQKNVKGNWGDFPNLIISGSIYVQSPGESSPLMIAQANNTKKLHAKDFTQAKTPPNGESIWQGRPLDQGQTPANVETIWQGFPSDKAQTPENVETIWQGLPSDQAQTPANVETLLGVPAIDQAKTKAGAQKLNAHDVSLNLSSGDTLSTDGQSWVLKNANGNELANNHSSPGNLEDGTVFERHTYNNIPPADLIKSANGDYAIIDEGNNSNKAFMSFLLNRAEKGEGGRTIEHDASLTLPSGDTLTMEGDHWDLRNAKGKEISNDEMSNKRQYLLPQKLENGIQITHTIPVGDTENFQVSYPNGNRIVISEGINNSAKDHNSVAVFWKPE